jgi:hypothetical protein
LFQGGTVCNQGAGKDGTGNLPAIGKNDFLWGILEIRSIDSGGKFTELSGTDGTVDSDTVALHGDDNLALLIR